MKRIKIFILFILILNWVSALSQTNTEHVYVDPYIRKDGTFVQGHFRTKANSTNRDNFSTIGNINPYTGEKGWIPPDNYYKYSVSDTYSTLSIESINSGDFNKALEYSGQVNDQEMRNLVRFRAYHGLGEFNKSLYHAKLARNLARTKELKNAMNQWILFLDEIIKAETEFKLISVKYDSAIESEDYKRAIDIALSIQSIQLKALKCIYLAQAYEMNKDFNKAIVSYEDCIEYESDIETINAFRSRIEFCEENLKYPKYNFSLEPKNIGQLLLFHTGHAYSELDSYLREYGFKIAKLNRDDIKIAYDRANENLDRYEIVLFVEDMINDSTAIKIISLEHSSYDYKKSLSEDFLYYRYTKDNVTGPISNFIGKEYGLEYMMLFDGVKTTAPELYVFGAFLFSTNGKVLPVNLKKYKR